MYKSFLKSSHLFFRKGNFLYYYNVVNNNKKIIKIVLDINKRIHDISFAAALWQYQSLTKGDKKMYPMKEPEICNSKKCDNEATNRFEIHGKNVKALCDHCAVKKALSCICAGISFQCEELD